MAKITYLVGYGAATQTWVFWVPALSHVLHFHKHCIIETSNVLVPACLTLLVLHPSARSYKTRLLAIMRITDIIGYRGEQWGNDQTSTLEVWLGKYKVIKGQHIMCHTSNAALKLKTFSSSTSFPVALELSQQTPRYKRKSMKSGNQGAPLVPSLNRQSYTRSLTTRELFIPK